MGNCKLYKKYTKNKHSFFIQPRRNSGKESWFQIGTLTGNRLQKQGWKQGKKQQGTPVAQGKTGSAQVVHCQFDIQRR